MQKCLQIVALWDNWIALPLFAQGFATNNLGPILKPVSVGYLNCQVSSNYGKHPLNIQLWKQGWLSSTGDHKITSFTILSNGWLQMHGLFSRRNPWYLHNENLFINSDIYEEFIWCPSLLILCDIWVQLKLNHTKSECLHSPLKQLNERLTCFIALIKYMLPPWYLRKRKPEPETCHLTTQ